MKSTEKKSTETILAEIQKDMHYLLEKQDNIIESFGGKFKMTDDRITRGCEKTTKLEERMTKAERVQDVRISNLTKVIAALAIGVTLFAQKLYAFIFG